MNAILELRQQRADAVDAMKALTEKTEAENRDFDATEQGQWEGLVGQVESLDKRLGRMEKLETAVAETRTAPALLKHRLGDSEERALAHFVRTGDHGALGEYRAANDTIGNETTAADGGYAVPTGHHNQIIARRDEAMLATKLGLMRVPGKGLTVNVPVDAEADVEFAATAEQDDNYAQTYARDMPAIGQVVMTLAKRTKKVPLTEELLEDEDSNLLEFVSN